MGAFPSGLIAPYCIWYPYSGHVSLHHLKSLLVPFEAWLLSIVMRLDLSSPVPAYFQIVVLKSETVATVQLLYI